MICSWGSEYPVRATVHLNHLPQNFFLGKCPPPSLLDLVRQFAPVRISHREVGAAALLEALVVLDDVAVLQGRENFDFFEDIIPILPTESGETHLLDHNLSSVILPPCKSRLPEASLAEDANLFVSPDQIEDVPRTVGMEETGFR